MFPASDKDIEMACRQQCIWRLYQSFWPHSV